MSSNLLGSNLNPLLTIIILPEDEGEKYGFLSEKGKQCDGVRNIFISHVLVQYNVIRDMQ